MYKLVFQLFLLVRFRRRLSRARNPTRLPSILSELHLPELLERGHLYLTVFCFQFFLSCIRRLLSRNERCGTLSFNSFWVASALTAVSATGAGAWGSFNSFWVASVAEWGSAREEGWSSFNSFWVASAPKSLNTLQGIIPLSILSELHLYPVWRENRLGFYLYFQFFLSCILARVLWLPLSCCNLLSILSELHRCGIPALLRLVRRSFNSFWVASEMFYRGGVYMFNV